MINLWKIWNALPDSSITSVKGADDSVARLSSLVRATCRHYIVTYHIAGPSESSLRKHAYSNV